MASASEPRSRFQLLGLPAIDRTNATQLGQISEVWVDLERQQVVLIGLNATTFGKETLALELSDRIQLGRDAVLINEDDLDDINNFDTDGLVKVIGSTVTTEDGINLGRIKDFNFNPTTGEIEEIFISQLGIPLVPKFLSNSYLMKADEIVNVGGDIIVANGTENRLLQASESVITKLIGVGRPEWDKYIDSSLLPGATEAIEEEEAAYYEEEYEEEYEEDYDGNSSDDDFAVDEYEEDYVEEEEYIEEDEAYEDEQENYVEEEEYDDSEDNPDTEYQEDYASEYDEDVEDAGVPMQDMSQLREEEPLPEELP